ncbi:tRNA dimethylallyltransferase [beta proteobacterium AAP99]|nr:tRNA dimethylallyltransferase [beta proteobacterium AAP99]
MGDRSAVDPARLFERFDALVISGPTASGKSALALQLAAAWAAQQPCEIISMDSAQVYRGMDIGTAKPSAAEQAAVPHHLIDLIDPAQAYSAAQFARDVQALIPVIRARAALPLIVGGTMLYFKALTEGLSALPQADAELRARIDAEAAAQGWPAMHARLATLDPASAARLAPNDRQRIQRALEVIELTGQPLSELQRSATNEPAPLRLLHISIQPERSLRREAAEQRFDAMLAAGLLDEVRALKARGDLHADLPSIRSVGYRQLWEHLDGQCDLATARERAITATRQLAKRQMTWLRGLGADVVLQAPSLPDLLAALEVHAA